MRVDWRAPAVRESHAAEDDMVDSYDIMLAHGRNMSSVGRGASLPYVYVVPFWHVVILSLSHT
jgi:hypothetical protein